MQQWDNFRQPLLEKAAATSLVVFCTYLIWRLWLSGRESAVHYAVEVPAQLKSAYNWPAFDDEHQRPIALEEVSNTQLLWYER